MSTEFVAVGKVDEISPEHGKAFPIGDLVVAVFRVDGQFFAIDDSCPHMGASLADGCVENGIVVCPWHGWRFDVRDGTWCDNPRVKTGSYAVRVVDGIVQVRVPKSS